MDTTYDERFATDTNEVAWVDVAHELDEAYEPFAPEPFDRAAHCRRIASLGGYATLDRYGENYMRDIGRRGYASTKALYGAGRAQEILKGKGWKRSRQFTFEEDRQFSPNNPAALVGGRPKHWLAK
jgi:hypothetical protein